MREGNCATVLLSELRVSDRASLIRDAAISGAGLLSTTRPGTICFLREKQALRELLGNDHVGAVVTTQELGAYVPNQLGLFVHPDPVSLFVEIHEILGGIDGIYGNSVETEVSDTAVIHERAYVARSNVRIGARAVIEPNATILEGVTLGADVVVRAGAVIGAEGFHVEGAMSGPLSLHHYGDVLIGAGTEIQSNTNVVRGLFGDSTIIGERVTIGGHCQIGHSVKIGECSVVRPFTLISGGCEVGAKCWIAAGVRISNGIRLGENSAVFFSEVVTGDIPADSAYARKRIMPKQEFMRLVSAAKLQRR